MRMQNLLKSNGMKVITMSRFSEIIEAAGDSEVAEERFQ